MMFDSRNAITLGASLLLAACASTPPGTSGPQTLGSNLDRLEALYRYQMAKNASGQQQNAGVYCLALGGSQGGDPPAALFALFGQSAAPVVPRSRCTVAPDSEGNVVRLTSGGRDGLILYVSSMTCAAPDSCTAEGGYYEANLSASSNTYQLARSGGRWVVTGNRLNAIS